jgi:hypothetical protein
MSSATPTPRRAPPIDEETVLEIRRSQSTLKVSRSRYANSPAVTLSFNSMRDGAERHLFIAIQPDEARAVAQAILEICDREGWP